MAIPGDIVRHDGEEKVVIDNLEVDGEPWVALRAPDDLDAVSPAALPEAGLEVVGHVEAVPGWIEDAPGQWRPSPFGRPA